MTKLTDYTLLQLKQLQTRIIREMGKRRDDNRLALLKRLRKLASAQGVELEELLYTAVMPTPSARGAERGGAPEVISAYPSKPPLPVKYRNPDHLEQVWSGRGRRPRWFQAWIDKGGRITELENAAKVQFNAFSEPGIPSASHVALASTRQ